MTNNKLEILLSMRDEATKKLKQFRGLTSRSTDLMKRHWLKVAAAVAAVTYAMVKMTKSLITASSTVEQYRTRLTVLLKDVEKGNQVFEDMADLAGRVPKTYEEIMASATDLTAVVRDGTKEVKQLMPMIVDLSAATGMSVQEVTGQMIRMYSAGAASADMFRERGVSAALGFQAGVSYSAEETMKIMIQQWEDGTGKFVGAADQLKDTFEGIVSMMQDAWFQFKVAVGEEIFEQIKLDGQALLEIIQESKEEGGQYGEVVSELATFFAEAYENAKSFLGFMIVGTGQVTDGWNEFKLVINSLLITALTLEETFLRVFRFTPAGLIVGFEKINEQIATLKLEITALEETGTVLAGKATKDHSKELTKRLKRFKSHLKEKKKELLANSKEEVKIKVEADKEKTESDKEMAKNMETTRKTGFSQMKRITNMAAQHNKGMAVVAQGVNIGEAIMNTSVGVTKALASAPPPLNFVLASIVGAMGAAEVALIAAQGFAHGTDSVPAMMTPGEMVFPRSMADAIRAGEISVSGRSGGGGNGNIVTYNINIDSPVIKDDQNIDDLVEEISDRLAQETERL